MTDRQFKGVWIPAEIWLDKRLTITEKAFYAEVESFAGNGRTFHKTNETIQEEYGIAARTVQRLIKKLVDLDLLECSFNGRQRHLSLGRVAKMTSLHRQNDESASPKCRHTNTRKETSKNTLKREEVIFPFEEQEFLDAWNMWLEERRERRLRKFTPRGEQAALHDLAKMSNQNHETAIAIIKQSIAKGWQGLHPIKGATGIKLDPTSTLKWANQ
jgi:hypothetical protein